MSKPTNKQRFYLSRYPSHLLILIDKKYIYEYRLS